MDTHTHQSDGDNAPPAVEIDVVAVTARDITQHFELLDESQPLLNTGQTPAAFLQILMDKGHHHDAVSFLVLRQGHIDGFSAPVVFRCGVTVLDKDDGHCLRTVPCSETPQERPTGWSVSIQDCVPPLAKD